MKRYYKLLFVPSIWISMVACGGQSNQAQSSTVESKSEATIEAPSMVITETTQAPKYSVIWESSDRRYDNAPMYLIVTDKNTHDHMHGLVDEFARKLSSKKFTLIAFDDVKAAEVYKTSHYGANEVNRIATKEQLKFMDKHIIGTYNGELESNGNPYEIMYHGFGFGENEVENFEPHL